MFVSTEHEFLEPVVGFHQVPTWQENVLLMKAIVYLQFTWRNIDVLCTYLSPHNFTLPSLVGTANHLTLHVHWALRPVLLILQYYSTVLKFTVHSRHGRVRVLRLWGDRHVSKESKLSKPVSGSLNFVGRLCFRLSVVVYGDLLQIVVIGSYECSLNASFCSTNSWSQHTCVYHIRLFKHLCFKVVISSLV